MELKSKDGEKSMKGKSVQWGGHFKTEKRSSALFPTSNQAPNHGTAG